jgi:hypothetical protein
MGFLDRGYAIGEVVGHAVGRDPVRKPLTRHTAVEPRLVLDEHSSALVDAVGANPLTPMSIAIHAPGGSFSCGAAHRCLR